MRVLVWNLFHGRADPPAGRPLLHEFASALADWEWDVALLQEVPPWWPALLARRCGADWRSARTSRNQLLPLRRAIASRRPDGLKSNGGGANAILVRPPWTITAHGRRRLRLWPERRVVHAVRVERPDAAGGPTGERSSGILEAWIGNVHSQLGSWDDRGMRAPLADLHRSVAQLEAWRTSASRPGARSGTTPPVGGRSTEPPALPPIVLGGDLNLPRDAVAAALPVGWARVASSGPDHVVGVGVAASAPSQRPDRGRLSDHAPLLVPIEPD